MFFGSPRCFSIQSPFIFQNKIDDGQVIFVNSMAGHRVAAMSSKFYTATKYAVTALLEGWRMEVRILIMDQNDIYRVIHLVG